MKLLTITFTLTLLVGFSVIPASAQIVDGLVAYWAFDEGSGDTVNDSSGNGHNGTLVGDPQWTDGRLGGGLHFDQTEDEVMVPFHENLNHEAFTICAWANAETGGTGHRAVISSRDDFPQRGYIFYADPNNVWQFWTGVGSGWNPINGPAANNIDGWDHLAGVYADNSQKFYVNGEMVGESAAVLSVNTAQELLIGAGANETSSHNYFFRGIIDEVCIFSHALSADEIMGLMNTNPTPVEAAGKIAITWGQLKAK